MDKDTIKKHLDEIYHGATSEYEHCEVENDLNYWDGYKQAIKDIASLFEIDLKDPEK